MATVVPVEMAPKIWSGERLVGSYCVPVYPPVSMWQPEGLDALAKVLDSVPNAPPLDLYLHVPFCEKKCDFCYYASYAGQSCGIISQYVRMLAREMETWAGRPAVRSRQLSTVFFGGGTPSMLSPAQLRHLNNRIHSLFNCGGVKEFTFECAPRSVRPELLDALHEVGATRISMGVESFSDVLLKLNGRIHLRSDVERAYELIHNAGFRTVNLDLMVGLSGETPELWHESVRRLLELQPESATIYQTEIPYNTQLYENMRTGGLSPSFVGWETKRTRLLYAFDALEQAGYTVVNAYTAVKDSQAHRPRYLDNLWHGSDLLAVGVSAVGYMSGVHFQNESALAPYIATVADRRVSAARAYCLTDFDQLVREFVLQLKSGAVDVTYFQSKFGVDVVDVFTRPLQRLAANGLLLLSKHVIRLTRPGLLRIDGLLPQFYASEFRVTR